MFVGNIAVIGEGKKTSDCDGIHSHVSAYKAAPLCVFVCIDIIKVIGLHCELAFYSNISYFSLYICGCVGAVIVVSYIVIAEYNNCSAFHIACFVHSKNTVIIYVVI